MPSSIFYIFLSFLVVPFKDLEDVCVEFLILLFFKNFDNFILLKCAFYFGYNVQIFVERLLS